MRDLDSRGVPGGFIASEEFRDAADTQGRALGFPARSVFVPHPIQDRTDDEMRALARDAFAAIAGMVTTADQN